MNIKQLLSSTLLVTFLALTISSCDTTSPDTQLGEGNVKLQFKTVTGQNKAPSPGYMTMDHDSITVEGSNGSLQIDDIRFIVAKFKLEPADPDDDEAEESLDTKSEEIEAGPFWVDLPLDEDTLNLGNSRVQAGIYEEFEFEVKDLDFDDEDDDSEDHSALVDSIRAEFPDWPDEASMIVTGSFSPADGETRSFKVFAKAEIEIEREFEPPLEITDDNMQKVLSVRINPVRWLQKDDGSVFDLSQYDWNEHQKLLEFEAEFEDGVEEIEVDEEDFDEDDDDDDEDDDDDNDD